MTDPGAGYHKKACMQIEADLELEETDGLTVAGAVLLPLTNGALYWPDERLLVVADLHLEKGSSFARRGVFLPPYDTAQTLGQLAATVARFMPRVVIALGDSFHDRESHQRLDAPARDLIASCQTGRDWIWISGNHDPAPPAGLGGVAADEIRVASITFRHEPHSANTGEIAGHLHPVAKVRGRGRAVRRSCFAADDMRLVMPAFGALTGGLNVLDSAFRDLFCGGLAAWLAGTNGVYRVAPGRLLPD